MRFCLCSCGKVKALAVWGGGGKASLKGYTHWDRLTWIAIFLCGNANADENGVVFLWSWCVGSVHIFRPFFLRYGSSTDAQSVLCCVLTMAVPHRGLWMLTTQAMSPSEYREPPRLWWVCMCLGVCVCGLQPSLAHPSGHGWLGATNGRKLIHTEPLFNPSKHLHYIWWTHTHVHAFFRSGFYVLPLCFCCSIVVGSCSALAWSVGFVCRCVRDTF